MEQAKADGVHDHLEDEDDLEFVNDRKLERDWFSRSKASLDTRRKTSDWKVWQCDEVEFSHDYDRTVSHLILEGFALLTFEDDEAVYLQPGDFMTIKKGASALWCVLEPLTSSYCYHDSVQMAAKREEQTN